MAPSLPTVLSDDDQKTMDAIEQSIRAHPAVREANTPETTLARVWAAEKQLKEARRAASRAFEAAGKDTEGMFAESAFVPRRTAERWLAEATKPPESEWQREKRERAERGPAPKTRAQIEMAEARSRGVSTPSKIEPEDPEAREQAVVAKFANATAEERARMIVEAASKCTRPPRSNK